MHSSVTEYNTNEYSNEIAFNYLERPHHARRLAKVEKIILSEVAKLKYHSILSLGPGNGTFEKSLIAKYNLNINCLEASVECFNHLKSINIPCVHCDVAEGFKSKSNSYDIVYAGELIEHMLDTEYFISEVYRVLKPNGVFILTTPNLARIHDRIKFLFGYSPRQIDPTHKYLKLHIRPFTWKMLEKVLKNGGFVDLKLTSHALEISSIGKYGQIAFLGPIFPTLSPTLIVSAKKN